MRKERVEEEKLTQKLRGEERKRRKDEQIKEQLMRGKQYQMISHFVPPYQTPVICDFL